MKPNEQRTNEKRVVNAWVNWTDGKITHQYEDGTFATYKIGEFDEPID